MVVEDRAGCTRTSFKHWTGGDAPADGCDTAGNRVQAVTRDIAARAAADGVEACSHCGADAALGTT